MRKVKSNGEIYDLKRVKYNGVKYEVHTSPTKTIVKNLETYGYVKKNIHTIASMDDETIRLNVNSSIGIRTYEAWSVEEAVEQLDKLKFKWESAVIYNSKGDVLREIIKG